MRYHNARDKRGRRVANLLSGVVLFQIDKLDSAISQINKNNVKHASAGNCRRQLPSGRHYGKTDAPRTPGDGGEPPRRTAVGERRRDRAERDPPERAPARGMKGRHQFRRRFSLQPSLPREPEESGRSARRSDGSDDAASGGGSPSSDVRYKIVVMGAAKVGKSSLISQFLYGTFSPRYKRTVEEMHRADFAVQGVRLSLDILDTSGSFEFPAMRALSISSADAFVLVYDVNDAATFEEAGAIRDQIHEAKASSQVPIVVVGNKVDLADVSRQMDYDTTESVVTVDWENGFVEASAKDNLNVSLVFKELLAQAKVKYDLSPALRRKRRQSLPPAAALAPAAPPAAPVPSPQQLAHLRQIRDRRSGAKRNSCVLS